MILILLILDMSLLLLVDYSGPWDCRFHFEKVGVVDASLPEAAITSQGLTHSTRGNSHLIELLLDYKQLRGFMLTKN